MDKERDVPNRRRESPPSGQEGQKASLNQEAHPQRRRKKKQQPNSPGEALYELPASVTPQGATSPSSPEHEPTRERTSESLIHRLVESIQQGTLLEEWALLPYHERRTLQALLHLFEDAAEQVHTEHLVWGLDNEWYRMFEENLRQARGTIEQQDTALAEEAELASSARQRLDEAIARIRASRSLNPNV